MIVAVCGGETGLVAGHLGDALEGLVIRETPVLVPGLGDVLAGDAELESVIAGGVLPHGWGLDRARHLRGLPAVLERLGRRYRHLVIACPETPPHTRNALCFVADLAVVVVAEKRSMEAALRARDLLDALETPIGGVLVIGDREVEVGDPSLPVTATDRQKLTPAVEQLVATLSPVPRAGEPSRGS